MTPDIAFRSDGWPKECCQFADRAVVCHSRAVWKVSEHTANVSTTGFFCVDHLPRYVVVAPLLADVRRRFVRSRFMQRHQAAGFFR